MPQAISPPSRSSTGFFTNIERRILQRYYENRHGDGRQGGKNSGKNKGLPPGLAKQLPGDLQRELPPRGRAYRRVIVDNDIVLIDVVTNKILDVIEDVIRGS